MYRTFLPLLLSLLFLTACGGGGGGGSSEPPTPPPVSSSSSGGGSSSGGSTSGGGERRELVFTDITSTSGMPENRSFPAQTNGDQMAGGLGAGDYDDDGDIDLYVVRGLDHFNIMLQNQGDGTFVDVTSEIGVNLDHKGSGPAFGDIDGDGDLDLFVGAYDNYDHHMLRNDGGTFTDITEESGLDITMFHRSVSASFADYDNDGDLDLFATHWDTLNADDNELLWQNNGDGTFVNVTVDAKLNRTAIPGAPNLVVHTLTHDLSDIDRDGDVDLLMAADFNTSQVYLNNGDGTFTWATDNQVITDENGMGTATGDYDGDGDMDWFVTSIFDDPEAQETRNGNRMYRNDGDGVFVDVTDEAGVRDGHWGWGACFDDFDNDGVLDIAHVNGWFNMYFSDDPIVFFHGNGDGTFTERGIELGLDNTGQGRGIICFDSDRDGDLDIMVANNENDQLYYYRNDVNNGNHYLFIKLRGQINTAGIGAWITLTTANGTQVREMKAASNFVSQNPAEVHFGLGDADVATVEVNWPGGGTTLLEDVAVDRMLIIEQPAVTSRRLVVTGGEGSGVYVEGDQIAIEAADREKYHFSHWTSNGGGSFADTRSQQTTFAMPDSSVTITANYVPGVSPDADVSVARRWNEVLMQAIRNDYARPTVHARNLFHISSAMYDAWTAYNDTAEPWLLGKTRAGEMCPFDGITGDAVEEAISFAAYRLIRHRFVLSPGSSQITRDADALMASLELDVEDESVDYGDGSGAALGNHLADCYIRFGFSDGANEVDDYANRFYEPVNPPLRPHDPGNPDIVDMNHWQPLTLREFIDQAGNPVTEAPEFLGPEWGIVYPFSLQEQDATIYQRDGFDYWVYHDPGPPPAIDDADPELAANYKWAFAVVAIWSSQLDPSDGVMVDISPASLGNISLGSYPDRFEDYDTFYNTFEGGDPGQGYDMNPVTGEPYEPQSVPLGDYARVLAEFWADGPDSETPPGHWFVIMNEVNDHEMLERRFEGTGEELDKLEWDVKGYFLMGGAMHDCAVAAWGIKGYYDYIRPVSALRAMADLGQSTDESLASYHENGIPLYEGYIELVESGDALAGDEDEHVGKIKFKAWRGPEYIEDPETDVAGVDWILAENWWPYQRPSFVTPPFAGYVSGHSTYSRAASEVMTRLTGSSYFPGGKSEFEIKRNEFLVFEDGPSVDMTLEWATYYDASDQTSLSRIWGGIHPPPDDIPGRLIGSEIGNDAFDKAVEFFEGIATD